uniref:Tetratricopeptide repeat protein 28 n=1 Tax=Oncorhynchus tshawytscha TaxID=74940 RepID=A0A8C8JRM6_ONCTS
MEKQATVKEKFSIFGSRTVGRAAQREAEEKGGRSGLNKAEFMERVQQSNEACQRGDFQAAVSLYGDALRADPQNCILYSNRSAALLKLGRYQASLDDAVKACLLNPKWPKALRWPHASQPKQFGRVCVYIMMTFCDVFVRSEFGHTSFFLKGQPKFGSQSLRPFVLYW